MSAHRAYMYLTVYVDLPDDDDAARREVEAVTAALIAAVCHVVSADARSMGLVDAYAVRA